MFRFVASLLDPVISQTYDITFSVDSCVIPLLKPVLKRRIDWICRFQLALGS